MVTCKNGVIIYRDHGHLYDGVRLAVARRLPPTNLPPYSELRMSLLRIWVHSPTVSTTFKHCWVCIQSIACCNVATVFTCLQLSFNTAASICTSKAYFCVVAMLTNVSKLSRAQLCMLQNSLDV